MALFNPKGEINASSEYDALQQIVKYASILQRNQSSADSMAGEPSYTDDQRNELIKNALFTPEGKTALGQAINC